MNIPWGNAVQRTYFLGVSTQKNPLDAWIMQEIIHETRPDYIIETGSAHGGSALYMATLCDEMKHGKIISVEITPYMTIPRHKRITFLTGDSVSKEILKRIKEMISGKVMVILDSNHRCEHVYRELELYAPLVTKGQYLIIEDTFWTSDEDNLGPGDAVKEYLKHDKSFIIDTERERFNLTYNPAGFLLKQ